MELIEKQPEFVSRFSRWHGDEKLAGLTLPGRN
jgi:hypothetical protein